MYIIWGWLRSYIDWFVRVGACLCVGVYPWVRGCVHVYVWVCGCWCEVWDGFVCVCGRVYGPHILTHTNTQTHART